MAIPTVTARIAIRAMSLRVRFISSPRPKTTPLHKIASSANTRRPEIPGGRANVTPCIAESCADIPLLDSISELYGLRSSYERTMTSRPHPQSPVIIGPSLRVCRFVTTGVAPVENQEIQSLELAKCRVG